MISISPRLDRESTFMGPNRPLARIRRPFRPGAEVIEARRLMAASVAADVLTYHDDNARDGQDLNETTLNPSDVNAASFGEKFTDPVDGAIYAQPLYMAGVAIPGQGTHNIVIVATQHDSVYAFDADAPGPALWHDSFINPSLGITSVPTVQKWQLDLAPEIGITGTPVIDPTTGTLYVAAKTETRDASAAGFHDAYTLHAIDVTTGAERPGGPTVIDPSVPGKGAGSVKGVVTFDAYRELQRPALLLANGVVYVSFGSLGGQAPYHGWVVGYSASTLRQVAAFNTTPNSNDPSGSLGGIWGGGAGPAADAGGSIYSLTGSGPFGPAKAGGNYSDAALKFTPTLNVADYFAPANTAYLDKHDYDLGSGGAILVPGSIGSAPNLLVGGGKLGILFAIKTAKMGHQSAKNPGVQAIPNPYTGPVITKKTPLVGQNIKGGFFTSPAYFNGSLYVNAVGDVLRQYKVANGKIVGPVAQGSESMAYPGSNISISADGTANGIVWTLENSGTRTLAAPAVLHAYDAANIGHELYTSAATAATNRAGDAVKFAVPTVANGSVYVGTKGGVTVYGLHG